MFAKCILPGISLSEASCGRPRSPGEERPSLWWWVDDSHTGPPARRLDEKGTNGNWEADRAEKRLWLGLSAAAARNSQSCVQDAHTLRGCSISVNMVVIARRLRRQTAKRQRAFCVILIKHGPPTSGIAGGVSDPLLLASSQLSHTGTPHTRSTPPAPSGQRTLQIMQAQHVPPHSQIPTCHFRVGHRHRRP